MLTEQTNREIELTLAKLKEQYREVEETVNRLEQCAEQAEVALIEEIARHKEFERELLARSEKVFDELKVLNNRIEAERDAAVVEALGDPVAVVVTANESIRYPHIERLVDIGTLPAGTKLYAIRALKPRSDLMCVPNRETRRVYKNSDEYQSYLNARFADKHTLSISFAWDGRRWMYQYTDFDDTGDYDILLAAIETKEGM